MKDNNLCVFGIGRVGLPLALVFADKGFDVWGIDINSEHVNILNKKKLPFLEEGAEELLKKHGGKKFHAFTSDKKLEALARSKYIILTLGTPIDSRLSPDHHQIESLFVDILPNIEKGHVIILRSTISPGTLRQIVRFVENNTKFKIGKDIFMAYCPERIAEGKSVEELVEIPQLIGCVDKKSEEFATKLFSKITKKIFHSKPEAVELAKLYCNMYRYIDFAIGNEFMMIAEDYGCDYYDVLNLVNNGYKRNGLKSSGFTAGPCLVKDGFFLIDKSPYMDLVMAAWRLNENVPGYLFNRIKKEIKSFDGKKVAILGVSFKKDIDDTRLSLVPKVQNYFQSEGANVMLSDPYIVSDSLNETLKNADVLFVGTNHSIYEKIDLAKLKGVLHKDCLICDVWNMFKTGKIIFKYSDILNKSLNSK